MMKNLRNISKAIVAALVLLFAINLNNSPAMAFAGTLQNGDMAYAQSAFNTGEACVYLPGYTTGYDAWHFVLPTRGATFQQSATDPTIAVGLNFVFMRPNGTLFVLKSGAWVQSGKGAYVYTPVAENDRMVQVGTLAQINGLDSGMRLSHTCPGSGSVVAAPSPTPTPTASASSTPTASATPTPTPTRSSTPTPTPTTSATPTPTPTRSATPTPTSSTSATPTSSATPTASPTPIARPTNTRIPTLSPRPNVTPSAIQIPPRNNPRPLPTPSQSIQPIDPTPTPVPTPTPTSSNSTTPVTPTTPPTIAPVLPTPPPVTDPKEVEYVDPGKSKDIDPTKFTDPPATPVEVTKEPTYGKLIANPNGTFTYTPPVNPPSKPAVDVVEFKYTNLSGEAVVVRKEFVMTVKGDVPAIIQTGDHPTQGSLNFTHLAAFAVVMMISLRIVRRFASHKGGQKNG